MHVRDESREPPNLLLHQSTSLAQPAGRFPASSRPYYVQHAIPTARGGSQLHSGQGYVHEGPSVGDGPGVSLGLNQLGDILMSTQSEQSYAITNYSIYNIHTNSLTDLSTLPVLINNGYGSSMIYQAIEDGEGRILLLTNHRPPILRKTTTGCS